MSDLDGAAARASRSLEAANTNIDKLATGSNSAASGMNDAAGGLKNFGSGLDNFGNQLSQFRLGGGGGGGGGGGFSIGNLLGGSGGNWFSGGGSGLFDWGFMDGGGHVLGNVITADWASIFSGFAEGGFTGHGGKYDPAGVVHRGEYVFDQRSTNAIGVANLDRIRRHARGYAEGGYVGEASWSAPAERGMVVNSIVHNYANANVEQQQRRNEDGSLELVTTVKAIVADDLTRRGSMTQKAVRGVGQLRKRG